VPETTAAASEAPAEAFAHLLYSAELQLVCGWYAWIEELAQVFVVGMHQKWMAEEVIQMPLFAGDDGVCALVSEV